MALEPLPPELRERTVRDLLKRNAEDRPGTTALVGPSQAGGEDRFTYSELASRSARLARGLQEHGVGKGERVAILLDQARTIEAHVAYHASHRIAAVNVPLNTRYVARELAYVLRFCDPRAIVFSPRFAPVLQELRATTPDAFLIEASAEPALGDSMVSLLEGDELAEPVPLGEDDDADWIFTSGTTGNPKAVALSHANSVACGYQSQRLWGLDEGSVYQSFAPFFTSTGCHTNLLACLAAGCTYLVEPEFDAWETLRRIERHGTTSIFLISGVIQLILERVGEAALEKELDLSSLRRIAYGGQPMSKPFYERVEEVFGRRLGLELVHLWGLTEGGTAGTLLPPELHAHAVEKAGEHGLSIGNQGFNEWVRFRVAREDDSDADPGEVGEIRLRGPSIMDRYASDAEATRDALKGGWLHTGDMGMLDEEGLLYFVDRKKQMIRRGGLNISSAEVEAVVMEHPAVAEVAVVARPNPILEQEPKAFVVLKEGHDASAQEIIEFCRERLADYKVPVEAEFIDALPRNAMGRVMKHALTGEGAALEMR